MKKLAIATALLLTTLGAHAQQSQQPPIQGWVIQQTDPKDLLIQQQANDALIQHMQDQYYKTLQRSNAHLNCVVNSWHPENCE